jgi:hypothetical protein
LDIHDTTMLQVAPFIHFARLRVHTPYPGGNQSLCGEREALKSLSLQIRSLVANGNVCQDWCRPDAQGALHHLMIRGIEGRKIVMKNQDRGDFLDRLSSLMPETESPAKQRRNVKARNLLCFWAVRELGISLTVLARHLGLSVPGIGYSVERREITARERGKIAY